jgi:hypothetical protein
MKSVMSAGLEVARVECDPLTGKVTVLVQLNLMPTLGTRC